MSSSNAGSLNWRTCVFDKNHACHTGATRRESKTEYVDTQGFTDKKHADNLPYNHSTYISGCLFKVRI